MTGKTGAAMNQDWGKGNKRVRNQILCQVWVQVWDQVGDQVWDQVGDQLLDQIDQGCG